MARIPDEEIERLMNTRGVASVTSDIRNRSVVPIRQLPVMPGVHPTRHAFDPDGRNSCGGT